MWEWLKTGRVKSLSEVPEDFRGLFRKEGDEYVLGSDDPGAKSAIAALGRINQALIEAREEAKTLRGKKVDLSPLNEWGDDPVKIKEAITIKLEELQNQLAGKDKDGKSNLEKIKSEMTTAHQKALEVKDSEIKSLIETHKQHLRTQALTQAMLDAKVDDPEIFMPIVTQMVDVVQGDDKQFRVIVKDDKGEIRYSGTTGAPMDVKELIGTYLKNNTKYARFFKSEATPGGGTPPNRTPARKAMPGGEDNRTPQEKIAAGLKKKN